MVDPVRVANIHDLEPSWNWIEPIYSGSPAVSWRSLTTRRSPMRGRIPGLHMGRIQASLKLRSLITDNQLDLVVSHGPYTTYYAEAFGRGRRRNIPHLAFAFNFTDIPTGPRLYAMRRAFARVDRFAVYSSMERQLYSEIFGIPIDKFEFVRWGVAPPISIPEDREIAGRYVAALGGEARDYPTFCEAARLLPQAHFVLIARPNNLMGLDVPRNMTVHTNLSWERAWSIMWHSDAVALPLRSEKTPNGLVTAVGSMYLGKAQVITDSIGLADYFCDEENALLVPAKDPTALATSIARLLDDSDLRARLGIAAQTFARKNCTERVTVEFFRALLPVLMKDNASNDSAY
jgi:glycosyltransferase involved in cell wall biosynthesis